MKFGIKFRLIALATGIGLMALAIVFMIMASQREATALREQVRQVDSESFRIADQFRDSMRPLNELLYQYGRSHTQPDLPAFTKASHELDLWIDEQKPRLTTAGEKKIMEQLDAAYDDYLRAVKALLARLETVGDAAASMDDYTEVRRESQRLFDLGQSLSRAHFASRDQILGKANRAISQLRTLTLVTLGVLLVSGLVLSGYVYRDMIAPLQTRLVESQTLLERHEKLASLGMLAAGIAHEIRNPLTAIKAALFIQQKKFQPGTQDHADAKLVEREILRLERIVSDFLLFARPIDPAKARVAAGELLREVRALLEPALAKNQIQLLLEDSPPLWINADAAQIKQVLINLVQNAAEAIGGKGVVKLRARADRKRVADRDQEVVILEVADNGKGIPSDVQKRLFDPFFTTKDTGTGLGLSIAAGIVQKHGGALQYLTQVDSGTTFGILLPQASE